MGKQRRKEKTVVVDQDREYLQHFADREERKAAAEALAKCTGDDSYPALITALKDDSDSCVRISAARALAKRKEPHAIEQIISAFNNALTFGEITKFELEEYAQILGKLGDPHAVSALINSLSTDRTEVRKIIMDILFNYVGQDTMPSLINALENQDYRILTGAASVLSRKGYKVTDPLMKALTSSHPSVRRGAAMALGDLKFKKSVGPLIAALKDNDPAVVQEVERSLGRIGLPGVDRLVGSLADPDRRIRLASTRVLGIIDFKNAGKDACWEKTISTAIDGLLSVLMDEDREVRKAAFLSLGLIGLPGVDRLVGSLAYPDRRIRLASTRVLGIIDFKNAGKDAYWKKTISTAIDGLLSVLMDEDREVRKAAFLSLGTLGGLLDRQWVVEGRFDNHDPPFARKVLNELIENLSDNDAQVRAWAVEALGLYGTKACIVPLEGMIKDPDALVKEATSRALTKIPRTIGGDMCFGPRPHVPFTLPKSPADTVIDTTTNRSPEPRYADVTFFYNDWETRVTEGQPLVENEWYRLKVTVTPNPTGITPVDGERPPIIEPKRNRTVKIMVVVEGDVDDFDIEENVQSFDLPPTGPTEPCWFRLKPKKETIARENLAKISIILLCDFFYVEKIDIQVEIIEKENDRPPVSKLGLEKPINPEYDKSIRELPNMGSIIPRHMTILVKKEKDRYSLRFVILNEEKNEIEFPAALRLSEDDLEQELIQMRKCWNEIAISDAYLLQLTCAEEDFCKHVRDLAKVGSQLWSLLFRQDMGSGLSHIGKWLQEHPLPDDSIIQIKVDDKDALGFIFPWALLYDKKVEERPDPCGFWGVRYCIEQFVVDVVDTPQDRTVQTDKVRLCFMMWEGFPNSEQHKDMFPLADATGRICIDKLLPICDAEESKKELKKQIWDVLYFYCHGYTKRKALTVEKDIWLQQFIETYRNYEDTDPKKKIFADWFWFLTSGQIDKDKDYIEMTSGKIYLQEDFYDDDTWTLSETKPIVFLNMCESAWVVPNLKKNFIHAFLNKGASCVIGTECTMTSTFAFPFAKLVFEDLLNGDKIGMAALKATRHFMKEQYNPLGLAYTIYGSVAYSFKPPEEPSKPPPI